MKSDENGISIITCSIKPETCSKMLESVRKTIGINFEAIVFDNREKGYGLCQVYNTCAKNAKFPYLCFVHEDIIMSTENWGEHMVTFAQKTQNCGIIGFAGGTIAYKNFLEWGFGPKGRYRYYGSATGKGKVKTAGELIYKYNNPENRDFAKVITTDGLFMFVSKEIWENNLFDETHIKGFHFYDADFSLNISLKYQNYVFLRADIYHFSGGNRNSEYLESALTFQKKWKNELPKIIEGQKYCITEELDNTCKLLFQLIHNGFNLKNCITHIIHINGYLFFFFMLGFMPIKAIKKIIYKI